MATPKKTQVVITANAAVAKKVIDELKQRVEQIKAKMASLDVTTKQGEREFKKLEKELVSYNSVVAQNIPNLERIKKAMDNLSGTSVNELKRALSAAKSELNKMSENDKGLKSMRNNVKALQEQIDKVTGSAHKQSSAWQTAMKNLTAYVGLFQIYGQIKQMLTSIINLNLKFSDQLADIRKVSGLATKDVEELANRLAKIDTRNTIEQLNNLAYQGAKLGIGKYGVDGLTRFAEATAQIRMALHEDMGDEAIAQLAKMAEVMHDMDSMGVSKALLASGSAIFKLGATTTATGSNIMEFSKRLLGLGKTADLTTPEILALGSAADSMALMPEVASTAFNKFITTLQSKYAQVAQAVGMNEERLKSMLDKHRTMDAIVEVLEHMRDMGDLNALAPIMGDLGSEGARLTNVFASMASNVQMLKDHLATSNEEFQKATAVTAEFDIQNETAQALMERASNIWEKTFVNSENAAGGIKDVAKAWYDMTKAITESGSFITEAGLSLKVLLWTLQGIIGAIPAVIQGLLFFGTIKFVNLGFLATAWNAVYASTIKATTAMAGWVGIQTPAMKQAVALAAAEQATAESMYAAALSAKTKAVQDQMLAATEEELLAANIAISKSEADILAAREMLAASTIKLAAVTKADTVDILYNSEAKVINQANTIGCTESEVLFATSKEMSTAMTAAETAAIAQETAAKEANLATTNKLRMVWGAVVFIGAIAIIDKMYEKYKALNAEQERSKEINDKIANGLANANKEYDQAIKNLRVLYDELERNWKIEDERKRLIGEINSRYGEYIGNLVDEQTQVGNLTKSYNDATDALREYYFYKQKEQLKADLVSEEQHLGDVSYVKFQGAGDKYSKMDIASAQRAVKEEAKAGRTSAEIANTLWRTYIDKNNVPGNWYMDLSKLPLVGGLLPENTFASEDQKAMTFLHDFVKHYINAANNEATINQAFPYEWTPPERPVKDSKNNTPPTSPDGESVKNDIAQFIANIKNFYKRQKTAFLEAIADDTDIDEAMRNEVLQSIDDRLEEALENARLAIVLGKKEWDTWKKTMDKDVKEKADDTGQSQSTMLLEKIQDYDTAAMRQQLLAQHYKVRKKKLVENPVADARDRAYMDKMWLDASGDEERIVKARVKATKARKDASLERDYVGTVDEKFINLFSKYGFAPLTDDEVEQITKGGEDRKNFVQSRRRDILGMFTLARKNIVDILTLESDKLGNGEQQNALLAIVFGQDWQNNTTANKIKQELGNDVEAWGTYYNTLVEYSEAYTEAEKKEYQAAKKRADFMWTYNKAKLAQDKAIREMQNEQKLYGSKGTFASNLGLADLKADPEVMLMQLKMQMAEDYYAFVLKNSKNQQLIQEADKARQEQELAYMQSMAKAMKDRLSQMKSLTDPIVTFGAAMGDAFAQMQDDAESAQEAIKNALKSMLKSWGEMAIRSTSTQLWEAINDAGVNSKRAKAQQGIADARANANANAVEVNLEEPKGPQGTATDPIYVEVLNPQQPSSDATSGAVAPGATDNGRHDGMKPLNSSVVSPQASTAVGNIAAQGANIVAQGGSTSAALAGMVGAGLNAAMNAEITLPRAQAKRLRDDKDAQAKELKKLNKEREKEAKRNAKEEQKIAKKKNDSITSIETQGDKEVLNSQETLNAGLVAGMNATGAQLLTTKKAQNAEQNAEDAARAQTEVTLSMAGALAKCFEFLGPIGGPIAAAMVEATLMGILQWALGSAFSSKKKTTANVNTKLASGMLTYDEGNLYLADNGRIYSAQEGTIPANGVKLLTHPTATTVNGQRALVAENGPELVVGRETTRYIQQNDPELLRTLITYDRNHSGRHARRTYDDGNVADFGTGFTDARNYGTTDSVNPQFRDSETQQELLTLLRDLRTNGIKASLDMWGYNGAMETLARGQQFKKRH